MNVNKIPETLWAKVFSVSRRALIAMRLTNNCVLTLAVHQGGRIQHNHALEYVVGLLMQEAGI